MHTFNDLPYNSDLTESLSDGIPPDNGQDPRVTRIIQEIQHNGGEWQEPEELRGAMGRTMFDLPNSKDNLLSILVPRDNLSSMRSQALVEIRSQKDGDGRVYQGIVIEGPFYEPDGLRADSPLLVVTTAHGMTFMPGYHGRVSVEVIGEVVGDRVIPPQRRPLPNSPVFLLDTSKTAEVLRIDGDETNVLTGVATGHDELEIRFSPYEKNILYRHTAVLGTTGGGKSTTIGNLVNEYQKAGLGVILIDTEGEYTCINNPSDNLNIGKVLERRNKEPKGISNTTLYHLHGREPSNPNHPNQVSFSLPFDRLSPYAVMEILDLNDAQQDRYQKAYEIARELLRKLKVSPATQEDEQEIIELDEMERGYPKLTLAAMYDVVRACGDMADKNLTGESDCLNFSPWSEYFRGKDSHIIQAIQSRSASDFTHGRSWRRVQGELGKLLRLKIFDNPKAKTLDYDALTQSGNVAIIDLSDTDSPQINNLAIAELMRGLLEQQDENYESAQSGKEEQRRVVLIIEEAHEFLSAQRIKQMPTLSQQVNRIARRGRKRWLGLTFVTQLPEHLPDEVLGLVNNFVFHKITNDSVISRLKKVAGNVDDSLWRRLPNLSAGQAIVRMEGMTRPLLVAIDPAPCKLRMVD